ncbi:ATP-binding protein [Streptomyces cinereospinus]|uniref:ATP-binding protein n=1 Tax=Streptomyces cinereospinus TaxID=285561 RepID=A0ABV5MU21_9ACTN
MVRRCAFRLPRHPASVGLARRRVRDHLTDWGHGPGAPSVADAVLLVSELATNVVRHAPRTATEFEVAVTALADGSCLLEVSDEDRRAPRLRAVDDVEEAGRGLHLVEHVAAAWGVWSRSGGKTVWALLTTEARGPL